MDKAVKKLRPVSSNKNGLAKRILLQNTDGMENTPSP